MLLTDVSTQGLSFTWACLVYTAHGHVLHLDGYTRTSLGPEMQLNVLRRQKPVLLLDLSPLQGPELHLDVSTIQRTVLHLEVTALQSPVLHPDVSTQWPELHLNLSALTGLYAS